MDQIMREQHQPQAAPPPRIRDSVAQNLAQVAAMRQQMQQKRDARAQRQKI